MNFVDQIRTALKDERIAQVRMHPVQEAMVEMIGITVTSVVNGGEFVMPFPPKKMTVGGRPMISDILVPEDEIWFEDCYGKRVAKLDKLEMPAGYP